MNTAQNLVHNWRLKALALGMSVFLWALVQTDPLSEEILSSVLRVEVADSSWTLAREPSPTVVQLRVDGPAREIIRLAREGATVRIPVEAIGSTDTVVTLRRDWVDLGQSGDVVVQSLSPAEVRLAFEPAVIRLVPLSMRLQGRVRPELALATTIDMSPTLVRVRGPGSRISEIDSIPLHAFDLGGVGGSGLYAVDVDTAGLGGGTVTPPTANLDIRVEDLVERVLDDVAVQAVASAGELDVVVEPASVRVTLRGARTLVTSLDVSRLRVYVPAESLVDMEPGEERRVQLRVEGVPALVSAGADTEFIRVRRAIDVGEGGTAAPGP